jgi:hypothetical protein
MKIFGQVLDTDGSPMSWANITITTGANALKMGVQSDLDGKFSLENASITPDSQFKVSFIGYVPQFFKASELQGKKIKLLEDTMMLDEVVITTGKPKNNIKVVDSAKTKFVQHLNKHKFVYAGLGGLAGVLLIVKALNKN